MIGKDEPDRPEDGFPEDGPSEHGFLDEPERRAEPTPIIDAGPDPKHPPLRQARQRLRTIGVVFAFLFLCIGYRLFDLVPDELNAREYSGSWQDEELIRRQDIVDRNGALIATDIEMPALIMDPSLISNPDQVSRKLANVLSDVDVEKIKRQLKRDTRYTLIRHKLSPAEQRAVLRLGIRGISFRELPHRAYPGKELASHLVGGVNVDNKGVAGIEYGMDEHIRERASDPLRLTIDLRIQQIARDALMRAYTRFKAQGGCTIVFDNRTGDVVSLVSLPDFDPNRVSSYEQEVKNNRCTGGVYELGSLFKVPTTAMALESGKVDLYDWFDATKPLKANGFRIRDFHPKKRALSTPEVFIFSSNIGTAKMAFQAGGVETQQWFLERIGMFEPPTLPIPEVRHPIVPKKWIDATAATVSFGHSLAISPMQLTDAVAAIGGNGMRLPPRIHLDQPIPEPQRYVSEEVARDMRWLMWLNVAKGTGHRAGSSAYLVGGKTGTAEKPRKNGRGYQYDKVISSFVASFPIEQPRYVVFAMLDEPQGDEGTNGARYGSVIAAPVVGEIIRKSAPLLGVRPSEPEAHALFERRLIETKVWNTTRGRQEKSFAALPVR